VETTVPSYIGQVPESLEGGITLESEPRVFRIDGGPAEYTAGAQVAAILDARARAVAEADDLAQAIVQADDTLADLETSVRSAYDDLQRLKATGAYTQYNAQVDDYNALVAEYNRAIRERNDLAARHNELAEIDRAVADGSSDRAETYAIIASF
jgi:chromosome segregation ATPase